MLDWNQIKNRDSRLTTRDYNRRHAEKSLRRLARTFCSMAEKESPRIKICSTFCKPSLVGNGLWLHRAFDVFRRTVHSQSTDNSMSEESNDSRASGAPDQPMAFEESAIHHLSFGQSSFEKEEYRLFQERLQSFSPRTYFGKPVSLSPLICARFG
jgi:hypothetical protein